MALNPVQERLASGAGLAPSLDEASAGIEKLLGTGDGLETDAPAKRDQLEASGASDMDGLDDAGGDTDIDEDVDDEGAGDEDDDGDEEGDETAEESETDAEEGFDSLEELAQALEVSVDDLSALSISFKAAGEDQTVTLEELTKGYARQTDYDRGKTALATEQRAFETEKANAVQEVQKQAVIANQLLGHFEQHFQQAKADPTLAELRTTNPAEWTARNQELDQQLAGVQQVRQAAASQYDQFMQENRTRFLQSEAEKLAQEIPDWGEDKLRVAVDTIKSIGYSDEEIVGMADSRLFKAALRFSTLQAENAALKARIEKGVKTAKTVKKAVPKALKPGKKVLSSQKKVARTNLAKAKSRLQKTGDVKDAADVIMALDM